MKDFVHTVHFVFLHKHYLKAEERTGSQVTHSVSTPIVMGESIIPLHSMVGLLVGECLLRGHRIACAEYLCKKVGIQFAEVPSTY